ncbi:MAG: proprotein convertase P-domain-containing protein [Planctomycetia bacterium]|nr:proprotein convertase P-domain-containing protein [Planctomycetia bacterium]
MFLPWSLITGRPKTQDATRRGRKNNKPLRKPQIKVELLEDRVVPANYFVDASYVGVSTGSLTQPFTKIQDALIAANNNLGLDNVYVYGNPASSGTSNPSVAAYVWSRDEDNNNDGLLDGNMDIGIDGANAVNMFFRASVRNISSSDGSGGAPANLIVKMRDNIVDVHNGSQLRIEGSNSISRVIFTSVFDDAAGGDANGDGDINAPQRANWGGIRYRADAIDQGVTSATGSIINFADIRYTGATIFDEVSGFPSEFGSIRMEADATNAANVRSAQVRVWNTIFNQGGRALDINLNSLGRGGKASSVVTGPDLGAATAQPLTFIDNSINGAFIFIPTNPGSGSLQQLYVNSTLDDVGVPYVITKRLILAGPLTTPGLPASGITLTFNEAIVFKAQNTGLDGIEFGQPRDRTFGTIVVNGSVNRPVLFTSLNDDSLIPNTDLASLYNNGSTDTNNDGNTTTPAPGDWAGIRIAQGNIDHALVRFGGGFAEVSGTFVNWPAIRVFTRDLRDSGGELQRLRISNTEVTQTYSVVDDENPQNLVDSPAIDLFSRDDQDARFDPNNPFLRTGDVQIIDNYIHDNIGKALQAHPMYLQDARNSMGGYGVFYRRNIIENNSNNGLYVPFILDLSFFNNNDRGAIDANLPLVGAVMDDTDIVTTIDGQLLIVRPDQYFAMMSRRTVVPDSSSGGYLQRFTDPAVFLSNLVMRLPGNLPTDTTKPLNLPLQRGPFQVNPNLVDAGLFYYQTQFDATARGLVTTNGMDLRGEEWRDWGVNFNYGGAVGNISDPLRPFHVVSDPSNPGGFMLQPNTLDGNGTYEMVFPNAVSAVGFWVVGNQSNSPTQRIELIGADGKLIETAAIPTTTANGRAFFGRVSRTPIYKVRIIDEAGDSPAAVSNFTTGNVNIAIPDNGAAVEALVNVPSISNINDIRVNLTITHARASDLILELVAPNGTVVQLANRTGGTISGANYTNTHFADNFTTPITAGLAPFSGTFYPVSYDPFSASATGLGVLDGINAAGTWRLRVRDAATGATGAINNFNITFKGSGLALNNPGITGLTWVDAGESLVVKANSEDTVITAASLRAIYRGVGLSQGSTGNIVSGFVPTMDNLRTGFNAAGQFTFGQNTNTVFQQNTPTNLNFTGDTVIPLQINSDFVANEIVVNLNLNYSGPTNQLRIQLQGPDGSRIDLVAAGAGQGNGNQSFINTTFDDKSQAALNSYDTLFGQPFQSPYDSTFTSFQSSSYTNTLLNNPTQTTPFGLGFYRGKNVRGIWSLIVTKNVAANTGTLQNFTIGFRAPVSGSGGTLRILGQGANPVILTGIDDDTVGAGPIGHVQRDTGSNGPSTASPGQWQGIQILPGVNTSMSEVVTTNPNGTINRRYADLNPYTRGDEGLTYPGLNNPNGVLLSTQDKILNSLAGNNDGLLVATRAPFDSFDGYNLQDGTLLEYAEVRFATTGVDIRTYPKTKLAIDGNEYEALAEPNGARPSATELLQPVPALEFNYDGFLRFETTDGSYTVAGQLGGSAAARGEGQFTDDVDWYELPSNTPEGVSALLYIDIEQGRRTRGSNYSTASDEPNTRQINVAVFNADFQLIYWSGDGFGGFGFGYPDNPGLMGNTLGPVQILNGNVPYNQGTGFARDAKYIAVMPFDRAPRSFFSTDFNSGVENGLQPNQTTYVLTPFQSDRMSPVSPLNPPGYGADGGAISLFNQNGDRVTITNDSIIDFAGRGDGTSVGGYEMNLRFSGFERNLNHPKPAEGQILIRSNTILSSSGDAILLQDSRMNASNTNLGANLPTQAARFPVSEFPNRNNTAATSSANTIYRNEDVNNVNPSQSSPANFIPGPTIQNNLIINNQGNGIHLRENRTTNAVTPGNRITPTAFTEISNNTIDGNAGVGILLETRGGPTVQNNIVSNNGTGLAIIDGYDITNLTPPVLPVVSYNIFYNNAVTGSPFTGVQNIIGNGASANPLYVDPSSQDYRIRPNSPAIDSAVSDLQDRLRSARSPQLPTRAPGLDLRGRPRVDNPNRPNVGSGAFPFYDRGALEANELSLRVISLSVLSVNNIVGSPVSSITVVFSGRVDTSTFNEDSVVLRIGSTSGLEVPINFNLSQNIYDANSDTHTFVLPLTTELTSGTFYFMMNGTTTGTAVRDIAGQLLDGEFPAPYSLPSGNGTAGGTFVYPFTIRTGTITGNIWLNPNGNGTIDPGEQGIPGIGVNLIGAGSDGILFTSDDVLEKSVTTGLGGVYTFANLGSGQYYVAVNESTLPTDYRLNTPPAQKPVNLPIGGTRANLNFGYWLDSGNGVVNGRVFNDINGNGVIEVGEPGITDSVPNPVIFTLTLTSGGADFDLSTLSDNITYVTTTDSNGNFSFTGTTQNPVFAGPYRLEINETPLPSTFVRTSPASNAVTFSLLPGGSRTQNFGYQEKQATVNGIVFNDADGNGVRNGGEGGIAGVTVRLLGAGVDGQFGTADDLPELNTSTLADGSYSFFPLTAGSYQVVVVSSSAVLANFYLTTGNDTQSLLLTNGNGTFSAADVGYRQDPFAGQILGLVFNDLNGNAQFDLGEPGFNNVTVQLRWAGRNGVVGDSDDQLYSATTNASGAYSATNLPVGDFYVEPISGVPAGYALTGPATVPQLITLGYAGIDASLGFFGYQAANSSINGVVFSDLNGDGIKQALETTVFAGVRVFIDANNNNQFDIGERNAVSAAVTGAYSIAGLPANLAGYRVMIDTATLPPSVPAGFVPSTGTLLVSLPPDTHVFGQDLGLQQRNSTVSGRVFLDSNNNGNADDNEVGSPGRTITLTFIGSPVPANFTNPRTFVTGSDGTFNFTGLPAGQYRVETTLPNGGTVPANPGNPQEFTLGAGVGSTRQFPVQFAGSQTTGVWYFTYAGSSTTLFNSDGSSLVVSDTDIVRLTALQSGEWNYSVYFRGSNFGLTSGNESIDAFTFTNTGQILISTRGGFSVNTSYNNGVPSGSNISGFGEDLIRFTPTSSNTGSGLTTGTWSLFFDGSRVGLSGSSENVDAVSLIYSGSTLSRILLSTSGTALVAQGSANPQDILSFRPTSSISLGNNTAGTFKKAFLGSTRGLTNPSQHNVDALFYQTNANPSTPTLYMSTSGNFTVPVALTGNSSDMLKFNATGTSQPSEALQGATFDSVALRGSDFGHGHTNVTGFWLGTTQFDPNPGGPDLPPPSFFAAMSANAGSAEMQGDSSLAAALTGSSSKAGTSTGTASYAAGLSSKVAQSLASSTTTAKKTSSEADKFFSTAKRSRSAAVSLVNNLLARFK